MANTSEATNVVVKNLTFFWAKLGKPVEPFGTLQWELQVRFPKDRVEEMEQYGTVKAVEGEKNTFALNLKKKALKNDGSAAQPIEVVGKTADEVIDPRTIGNGSVGNVKLMLRDYEIKGPNGKVTKRGTQVMLTKVQVKNLVKYTPKTNNDFDFDDISEEQADRAEAVAKKSVKSKRAAKEEDDEIPF